MNLGGKTLEGLGKVGDAMHEGAKALDEEAKKTLDGVGKFFGQKKKKEEGEKEGQ